MKKTHHFWLCWLVLIVTALACNYPGFASQPTLETPVEVPSGQPGEQPEGPQSPATLVPVDPHVELRASAETLRVGETITITATPVAIGLPVYELIIRDEGVQDAAPVVSVTYDGLVTPLEGSSSVLEFVSAANQMEEVTFTLRGIRPGITTVGVVATGEIQTGLPGTEIFGGGSGVIQVQVVE